MAEPLLQLKDIAVHYGGVRALDGVSLALDEGEIVALMGPNGAGKSTVLKAIFGLVPLDRGQVLWHQAPLAPVLHEVVRLGVAFVPQGRRVFAHLTVEENLEIGGLVAPSAIERTRRLGEVMETFPLLKNRCRTLAGRLSGGQQQLLAIARGLMADPKVLLLDEPTLGLAPKVVQEVLAKVKEINERHRTAIMVVEHNIKSLLQLVHRAYVLDKGVVVAHGTPTELKRSTVLERVLVGATE